MMCHNRVLVGKKNDLILVGRIGAPHGLKGEVKVNSFSDFLKAYERASELFLEFPKSSKYRVMKVLRVRFFNKKPLVLFRGVNNRRDARYLVDSCIYVEKFKLPSLQADTFFWSDLVGICVKSVTGEIVGILESIIQTGANDVYVVKSDKNGKNTEILLPAIRSVIVRVDLSKNLMVVNLPRY